MKKCLITGAAGLVGLELISKLLNEKKYEITALDLKNAKNQKALNKYKKNINIVYGDITDKVLMKALITDHDIIFHLAGVMPPTTEIHPNLVNIIDYEGSKNLINLIKEYNPDAYLIFLSTTAMYGYVKEVNLKSELNIYNNDIYSQNKYKIENYITKNIKNYTIYRVPMILDNVNTDVVMFNVPRDSKIEVITNNLVAEALVKSLSNKTKLNRHIFIMSGGPKYRTTIKELIKNVLSTYGISLRYIVMSSFIPQNFHGHYYEDSDKLNKILKFQKGSINDVYANYQKNRKFKRCLNRLIGNIIINRKK